MGILDLSKFELGAGKDEPPYKGFLDLNTQQGQINWVAQAVAALNERYEETQFKYADPPNWDADTTYDANTIVNYGDTAYLTFNGAARGEVPGKSDSWKLLVTGAAGEKGADGAAATVAVGTVTTGEAGTQAVVENAGTENAAVLNFTIPQGEKGDKGEDGVIGRDGAAATVAVGTVTTGEAGTQAVVENAGTENAAVLNFTIPQGEKGADGAAGTIEVGTVEYSESIMPEITKTGTSEDAKLNFSFPRQFLTFPYDFKVIKGNPDSTQETETLSQVLGEYSPQAKLRLPSDSTPTFHVPNAAGYVKSGDRFSIKISGYSADDLRNATTIIQIMMDDYVLSSDNIDELLSISTSGCSYEFENSKLVITATSETASIFFDVKTDEFLQYKSALRIAVISNPVEDEETSEISPIKWMCTLSRNGEIVSIEEFTDVVPASSSIKGKKIFTFPSDGLISGEDMEVLSTVDERISTLETEVDETKAGWKTINSSIGSSFSDYFSVNSYTSDNFLFINVMPKAANESFTITDWMDFVVLDPMNIPFMMSMNEAKTNIIPLTTFDENVKFCAFTDRGQLKIRTVVSSGDSITTSWTNTSNVMFVMPYMKL